MKTKAVLSAIAFVALLGVSGSTVESLANTNDYQTQSTQKKKSNKVKKATTDAGKATEDTAKGGAVVGKKSGETAADVVEAPARATETVVKTSGKSTAKAAKKTGKATATATKKVTKVFKK